MPLPILHSYAGYSIHQLSKADKRRSNWKRLALFMLLANLADFDFFPGILCQQMNRFHRGITHSIGAALIIGILIGLFCFITKREWIKNSILSSLAYFSHVVLDLFGVAGNWMPVLWPFSLRRFDPPVYLFGSSHEFLKHDGGLAPFLMSFLSARALAWVSLESAIVLTLWAGTSAWVELKQKVRIQSSGIFVRGALAAFCWFSFMLTRGMG